MTPEIEHYVTMAAIAVSAITPVARAMMKFAHFCQRHAMASASKADDAWAVRFVIVTESFCGFLTKATAIVPRLTIGKGVER